MRVREIILLGGMWCLHLEIKVEFLIERVSLIIRKAWSCYLSFSKLLSSLLYLKSPLSKS